MAEITYLNEQIANAASQQQSATETLNENINSINDMPEQNLNANIELATINQELEESVKQF